MRILHCLYTTIKFLIQIFFTELFNKTVCFG